jgi:hypothetical protein
MNNWENSITMSMRHGDYKFYENFEFFGNFGNLEIF